MAYIPASMLVSGWMTEKDVSDALSWYIGNPDTRLANVQVHASGAIVKTMGDGTEVELDSSDDQKVLLEAAKILRSRANASDTQARADDHDSFA